MLGQREDNGPILKQHNISVRVNMTSQRRRHRDSNKSTVVSVANLLFFALPPSAYYYKHI